MLSNPFISPTAPGSTVDDNLVYPRCGNDELDGRQTSTTTSAAPTGTASGAALMGDLLWTPGQTIHYYFQQQGDQYKYRQELFEHFLSLYKKVVNLHFAPWPQEKDPKPIPPAGPSIRVFFTDSFHSSNPHASWCLRGKESEQYLAGDKSIKEKGTTSTDGRDDTTLCLYVPPGANNGDTIGFDEEAQDKFETRVYIHELGHLLGLIHEQDSPGNTIQTEIRQPDGTIIAKKVVDPLIGYYTFFDQHSVMLYDKRLLGPTEGPGANNPKELRTRLNPVPSETDIGFWNVRTLNIELPILSLTDTF